MNKQYFKHILALLLVYFAIIWLVLRLIGNYTRHGIEVNVPDFSNINAESAAILAQKHNLRVIVVDSVYNPDVKRGVVFEQNPSAKSKVKQNRLIYLTINAFKPPLIKMPNLVDMSLRQASAVLQSYGLETGNLVYEPDFAKDAVLKQLYRNKPIKPGTEIQRESKIDLVLGDGLISEKVVVPSVIGSDLKSAREILHTAMLNSGSEVMDKSVKDSLKAKVYRQIPAAGEEVNAGRGIDLFLTQDQEKINSNSSNDEPAEDE